MLSLKLELFNANAGANAGAAGANAGASGANAGAARANAGAAGANAGAAGANAGAARANVYWLNGWISIGLASDSQRDIIVYSMNPSQYR